MPALKKTINHQKDVSIEYAHIYTKDSISEEQSFSLDILKKLKTELDKSEKSFYLMVMVDDYSFPDPSFDYGSFSWWLGEKGFKPDLILRESQLIPLCDQVINHLKNEKMKEQMVNYIKIKKYPCSLFIAAWYLLRLGYLKHVIFDPKYITPRLINILPESFKPYEDKALEIIAATEFSGAEKLIDYHYIPGRSVVEKTPQSNGFKHELLFDNLNKVEYSLPVTIKKQLAAIVNNLTIDPVEDIKEIVSRKNIDDYETKRHNAKYIYKVLEKEGILIKDRINEQIKSQNREERDRLTSLLTAIEEGEEDVLQEYGFNFKSAWLQDILTAVIQGKLLIGVRTIVASPTTQLNHMTGQFSSNPWGLQPEDIDIVGIELAKLFRKMNPTARNVRLVIAINEFLDVVLRRPLTQEERDQYVLTVLNFLEFKGVITSDDLAGLDFYVLRESQQVPMIDELIKLLKKSHYGSVVIEDDGSMYFKPSHEYISKLNFATKAQKRELMDHGILLKHIDGIPTTYALDAASYLNPIYKYFMHICLTDIKNKIHLDKTYILLRSINVVRGERSHDIYFDSNAISPDFIIYCINKMLQRFTQSVLKSFDLYDDWAAFDPYEYVERNYGNKGHILPEDKEIIKHVIQGLKQIGIAPKSLKHVADVASGPNLYPSMLLSPYLHKDAILDLLEFSPNRTYLQKVIDGTIEPKHASIWHKFENYMIETGGEIYEGTETFAKKKAHIQFGNIFELPKNRYELISSYFGAESIVDSQMPFREAIQSMANALKQDGLLIVAHMVRSEGYHAGVATHFPAVNLSFEQIKQAYWDADLEIIMATLVGENEAEKAREGYHGMAVIMAHPKFVRTTPRYRNLSPLRSENNLLE